MIMSTTNEFDVYSELFVFSPVPSLSPEEAAIPTKNATTQTHQGTGTLPIDHTKARPIFAAVVSYLKIK